jgi:hypothetical protein
MSLYLTQLELHKQSIELNIEEVEDCLVQSAKNIERLGKQKDVLLKTLEVANQQIEQEKRESEGA